LLNKKKKKDHKFISHEIISQNLYPPPKAQKNISDIPTLFAKEKQRVACMILQGAEASQLQEGGCTCASVQGQQLQHWCKESESCVHYASHVL
jgi:hypothetical protein